jgi:hypothetical protein
MKTASNKSWFKIQHNSRQSLDRKSTQTNPSGRNTIHNPSKKSPI